MQDSRTLSLDPTTSILSDSLNLSVYPSEFPPESDSYLSVSSIHKVRKERPSTQLPKLATKPLVPKQPQRSSLDKTQTEYETCEGTFENDSALMEISAVLMVHECKEILQDLQQKLSQNVERISMENEENVKLSQMAKEIQTQLKYRQIYFAPKFKPGCSCSIV